MGTAAQNVVLSNAATNLGTVGYRTGSAVGGGYTTTNTTVARPAGYTSYTSGGAVNTTTAYTGGKVGTAYISGASRVGGAQYVAPAQTTYTTTQGIAYFLSIVSAPVVSKVVETVQPQVIQQVQQVQQVQQPVTVSQVQRVDTGYAGQNFNTVQNVQAVQNIHNETIEEYDRPAFQKLYQN